MAAKIRGVSDDKGAPPAVFVFWCPGCKDVHPYRVRASKAFPATPVWGFNGDTEKPTFTPSLLCNANTPGKRCHLFLTDGQLHFCGDCDHELKGKTVPCPDWDDEKW